LRRISEKEGSFNIYRLPGTRIINRRGRQGQYLTNEVKIRTETCLEFSGMAKYGDAIDFFHKIGARHLAWKKSVREHSTVSDTKQFSLS